MVRTSTDRQSTEEQHKEMEDFCISEGYKKNQIVWVEEQGASAAKVDDAYRAMIEQVKAKVEEDPDIKCFAVWHLNRLSRTEEMWVEAKSFFVRKQVQIICKNPYLKLLTPDGKVDPGMELAMGLLAILAKQDNEERKAKFHRKKKAMKAKGQYLGGHTMKYGYAVKDKFFVEDKAQAKVVRDIFNMYSTGQWSSYTLAKELSERGIKATPGFVTKTLSCPSYYGEEIDGRSYPALITKELYDKCAAIRDGNRIEMKRGERLVLGAKLIKCCKCGATYTSNSRHYVCCLMPHGKCDNTLALRQCVADELLWRTAEQIHLQYLIDLNENQIEEYKAKIEELDDKIYHLEYVIEQTGEKKGRIVESYMEGLIDKENRDLRLKQVEDDVRVHRTNLNALAEKRDAIAGMLGTLRTDYESGVEAGLDIIDTIDGAQEKYNIIHQHIKSLVPTPVSYGKRDPRTHKPNGVEIVITAVTGQVYKYMYIPKSYQGHNLYVWNGKKWVPDSVTITDKKRKV